MLTLILVLAIMNGTLFVTIGGLALADPAPSRSKYILIVLTLSACGWLVDFLPPELPPSRPYELLGMFFGVPLFGLIWWFALSLLDDRFRINRKAWIWIIIICAPKLYSWANYMGLTEFRPPILQWLRTSAMIGVIFHIFWVGFTGRKDDLVTRRRQVRVWIALLPATVMFAHILLVVTMLPFLMIALIDLLIALVFSALTLFSLVRFQTSVLSFSSLQGAPLSPEKPLIKLKDTPAYTRLIELMERDKAYLDSELSVTSLSQQVGVPAHQLRTIINGAMGHRNFSSFLATYRIADVKAELAAPEQRQTPILTIALSTGFSSIATFNRTFKAETGITASEYRKSFV